MESVIIALTKTSSEQGNKQNKIKKKKKHVYHHPSFIWVGLGNGGME